MQECHYSFMSSCNYVVDRWISSKSCTVFHIECDLQCLGLQFLRFPIGTQPQFPSLNYNVHFCCLQISDSLIKYPRQLPIYEKMRYYTEANNCGKIDVLCLWILYLLSSTCVYLCIPHSRRELSAQHCNQLQKRGEKGISTKDKLLQNLKNWTEFICTVRSHRQKQMRFPCCLCWKP